MNKPQERRHYQYYDLIMVTFVTVLLLSNMLSSAKIIDFGFKIPFGPLGSLAFLFDAGTLVFPISYIFGDVLTEVYGYKRSRRVIWAGFTASALMAVFIWIAGRLPGEAEWEGYAGQVAYNSILGGVKDLVIASLIAFFAGEFLNSYVLAKLKVRTGGQWLPLRTIASTLVGQAADTSIFFLVATYVLGFFPSSLLLSLIVSNYIFKVAIEVCFTPLTVQVVKTLKAAENEDYFDRDTDFNPFSIRV